MKIIFISDIHGIPTNLNIIDNQVFDKLVVLGDLYNGSNDDKKIEDFLTKYKDKLICMKGNCDRELTVYNSSFQIIKELSTISVDNLDIYITHGDKYNRFSGLKVNKGILVYGHEHIPYIEKDDDMIYICVGSISLPRGGSSASYMVYENNKFTIYNIDGKVLFTKTINKGV